MHNYFRNKTVSGKQPYTEYIYEGRSSTIHLDEDGALPCYIIKAADNVYFEPSAVITDGSDHYYPGKEISGIEPGIYTVTDINGKAVPVLGKTFILNEDVNVVFDDNYIRGDVNGDTRVDINDLVCIINYMAGNADWPMANLNDDYVVDINDVVALINIMAGK